MNVPKVVPALPERAFRLKRRPGIDIIIMHVKRSSYRRAEA